MLRNSPTIAHIIKRDIFQLCFNQNEEKYDKSAVEEISAVFGTFQRVDCRGVFWNGTF